MKRLLLAAMLAAGLVSPAAAEQPKGLQIDDLFRIKRVSDPQISPDGRAIAYVVTSTEMAKNARTNQIWLVPAAGGAARQLTTISTGADGVAWSPDGATLLFVSDVYPDCADDDCNRTRAEAVE